MLNSGHDGSNVKETLSVCKNKAEKLIGHCCPFHEINGRLVFVCN